MSVSKIRAACEGYPSEPFSTNNAWGFGGGAGTQYYVNGLRVRIGVASFRHLPDQEFVTITDAEGVRREPDLSRKCQIEHAIRHIKTGEFHEA